MEISKNSIWWRSRSNSKSRPTKSLACGGTTAALPDLRFKSIRAIGSASSWTTIFPNRPPCIGMALKSPTIWTARLAPARTRSNLVDVSFTNSRCIRRERTSSTRTWPMQEMMGMLGAFIMHPKQPYRPAVDKDFLILMQEYAVLPNNIVPNSMNMEFNWLLFNGKAGPAPTPLIVRLGDRVRIRMANLGMDHHPIHLHGHTFHVTGTEGGRA